MKTTLRRRNASISRDRAARLHNLLQILEVEPANRRTLLRKLKVGMRTFYRDLDILRQWGIHVELDGRKYALIPGELPWIELLPFPDPELSFAEAISLASSKSPGGKKLQALVSTLI